MFRFQPLSHFHVSKSMDETAMEISKLNTRLDAIVELLEKDYEEWTLKEKQKFGNHEQVREEKKQLRDKEQELLKQQTLVLQRDQNQGIASLRTAGTAMDIDSAFQSTPFVRTKSYKEFNPTNNLDLQKKSDSPVSDIPFGNVYV
jgi:chromosome condensin MukBEF ATPase and DNA-binding subunit MukB